MGASDAAKKIEDDFLRLAREAAASRGLEFQRTSLKDLAGDRQMERIWGLLRKEPDGVSTFLHVIHFKIKSEAGRAYRYDWGVGEKLVAALNAASARTSVPWSLVLLHGGAQFGYCLGATEVEGRRTRWERHGDQYKIMEEPLPVSLYFRDVDRLFRHLGVGARAEGE